MLSIHKHSSGIMLCCHVTGVHPNWTVIVGFPFRDTVLHYLVSAVYDHCQIHGLNYLVVVDVKLLVRLILVVFQCATSTINKYPFECSMIFQLVFLSHVYHSCSEFPSLGKFIFISITV